MGIVIFQNYSVNAFAEVEEKLENWCVVSYESKWILLGFVCTVLLA